MSKNRKKRRNIEDFTALPLFRGMLLEARQSRQLNRQAKVLSMHNFRKRQANDETASIISGYLLLAQKAD